MDNRLLLYCILPAAVEPGSGFASLCPDKPDMPLGVDDRPVALVCRHEICAVVSELREIPVLPDIGALIHYREVTAFFHRHPSVRAVIPMRYGCLMENRRQIERLLEQRRGEYRSLLSELDGCVEMGIRLIGNSPPLGKGTDSPENMRLSSGKDYLARRKRCYEGEDRSAGRINSLIEGYRKPFSGLFVKFRSDSGTDTLFRGGSSERLISLYFLVPRGSVGRFKETFRQTKPDESVKSLLSGPWPPYNFV